MKYRTNINGRLFELSSSVPLTAEQQQAQVLNFLRSQEVKIQSRNFPLMTVAGTRTRTGRT